MRRMNPPNTYSPTRVPSSTASKLCGAGARAGKGAAAGQKCVYTPFFRNQIGHFALLPHKEPTDQKKKRESRRGGRTTFGWCEVGRGLAGALGGGGDGFIFDAENHCETTRRK